MEHILDQEQEPAGNAPLYTFVAFVAALVYLTMGLVLLARLTGHLQGADFRTQPPLPLLQAMQLSCLVGVVASLMSLIREEKLPYVKTVVVALNLLVLLFFMLSAGLQAVVPEAYRLF